MPANVESMLAVKIPTCRGIEDLLQEPPTTEEAIQKAGLDWEVELAEQVLKNDTVLV